MEKIKAIAPPPLSSNVNLVGRKFSEYSADVGATNSYQYTAPFETIQQSTVTFFVKNTGANSAKVKLQISPKQNEADYGYTDDSVAIVEVSPGEIVPVVPMIFSRYVRVAYKSDLGTNLKIIVQMQI